MTWLTSWPSLSGEQIVTLAGLGAVVLGLLVWRGLIAGWRWLERQ